MGGTLLNDREERVLEAVIRTYVETAEPAGSRTVAKRFPLGVSPATVRNTMSDLEDKGFLFHPHTSAGRVPTDLAYRYYVDTLMRPLQLTREEQRRVRRHLGDAESLSPLDRLIRTAAQVVGLLSGELGVAIAPRIQDAVLEKLELVPLATDKVLLVLTLRTGVVRTVYVDLRTTIPPQTLLSLTLVLNERLAGLSLGEIRRTLPDRLRDLAGTQDLGAGELLNIFLQSPDEVFEAKDPALGDVHLGRASVLADQPEFTSGSRLRGLLELTERRDLLADVLSSRDHEAKLKITIGGEHREPELNPFTLVTSEYRVGNLTGVIGVIGPTRMPYEKVAAIVEHTSALVSELWGGGAEERPSGRRAAGEA
jgi:heat-inducible transcriptional repressor